MAETSSMSWGNAPEALPSLFQAALERAVADAHDLSQAAANAADWKTRLQARRQAERKRILPGFPRTTPLRNHAEIKGYLATPELTCLVCGKSYRLLATHLRDTHGIEPDDYRAAYGIPWTVGLVGGTTSAKQSANLKEKLADPAFAAAWFAQADQFRQVAHEKARRQRSQPFRKELSRAHLQQAGIVVGRWQEQDFLGILEVMKEKDLLLRDVAGKTAGLPPYGAATKWFYSTPERHRRLVETVHQLSIRSQARAGMYSPRLVEKVQNLRAEGKLQREIAALTGLSVMTVAKLLRMSHAGDSLTR